jgi:hypothetical protein
MSYKIKIRIDTDSDFVLKFEHPNTQYNYKSIGGRIGCTLYYDKTEQQTKEDLIMFLRSLDMVTRKDGLKNIFDESIYNHTVDLEKLGLHSNHSLLNGNYEMEVVILQESSEYL